jgi:hypothetical protein
MRRAGRQGDDARACARCLGLGLGGMQMGDADESANVQSNGRIMLHSGLLELLLIAITDALAAL